MVGRFLRFASLVQSSVLGPMDGWMAGCLGEKRCQQEGMISCANILPEYTISICRECCRRHTKRTEGKQASRDKQHYFLLLLLLFCSLLVLITFVLDKVLTQRFVHEYDEQRWITVMAASVVAAAKTTHSLP